MHLTSRNEIYLVLLFISYYTVLVPKYPCFQVAPLFSSLLPFEIILPTSLVCNS